MKRAPRFIALATCIAELYALDDAGRVWSYEPRERGWRRVPARRLAGERATARKKASAP